MAEAFPISGNIDPKAFPFLLMDLHRQGATGSLKVEGPAYPKALYYRSGRILFGSSNDPKDQLGAILIENGKITAEQLADVNTKVGPGNPLAKVLAESGFVNQRELGEAARIKVERILSDIVGYTAGSFEFEDGVLPKGAVDLKLSTEKLVLAAVRRIADRSFVLRHLKGLDAVLAAKGDAAGPLAEIRADASDLPSHLNGQRPLKEAAQLARVDEFEAAKIACALLFLGLVEPAEAGTAVSVEPELDLAATAAMAFGGAEPPSAFAAPASSDDDPFFTGASEPPALDAGDSAPFPMPASEPFPTTEEPFAAAEPGPFATAEPEADLSLTVPGLAAFATPPPPAAPPARAEATGFSLSPELETTALPVMEPPAPPPAAPAPAPFTNETPSFRMPPFSPEPLGHEPGEVGHEPMAPSRPSKEDLAALDALLNPATTARPLEPVKPAARSGRWEPQFQSMAKPRRPTRSQASPVLLISLGVGLIAVIAAGSWYYLNYVQAPPPAEPPVTQARTTSPPSPALPAPTPTPEIPQAAPSATAGGPGTTPTAPPPTPAPTPEPTPRPRPVAPAASPLDAGPVTDARSLMRRGSFGPAAKGFADNVRAAAGSPFTIQLLVACSSDTVQKALDKVEADDLYILPVSYKGKSCHRICWGLYDSEAGANSAVPGLPDYFRQNGATPKVVRTTTLLR